jgi:uncharacterized membrane protein
MLSFILANHHDGWGSGPGPWLFFPWLLFIAIAAVAYLVWRRRRPTARGAQEVLAERYARGDITAAEYQERLTVLKEK